MARAIFRNHMNTVERVTVYGHTSSLSDSVRLRHGSVAGGSAGGRIGGGTSAVRARAAAHVHLFSHIYNINEANYYMIGGGTRPRMARASRGRPARGLRPYLSYRWSSNSKRHFRHRTLDCGHTQTRPHGLTAPRAELQMHPREASSTPCGDADKRSTAARPTR